MITPKLKKLSWLRKTRQFSPDKSYFSVSLLHETWVLLEPANFRVLKKDIDLLSLSGNDLRKHLTVAEKQSVASDQFPCSRHCCPGLIIVISAFN